VPIIGNCELAKQSEMATVFKTDLKFWDAQHDKDAAYNCTVYKLIIDTDTEQCEKIILTNRAVTNNTNSTSLMILLTSSTTKFAYNKKSRQIKAAVIQNITE